METISSGKGTMVIDKGNRIQGDTVLGVDDTLRDTPLNTECLEAVLTAANNLPSQTKKWRKLRTKQ